MTRDIERSSPRATKQPSEALDKSLGGTRVSSLDEEQMRILDRSPNLEDVRPSVKLDKDLDKIRKQTNYEEGYKSPDLDFRKT